MVTNDETPSEDGETPSVAAKWKHLFEKHKQKIIYGGGGAALVIAAGVVWSLARGQDGTVGAEDFELLPAPDPVADLVAWAQKPRRSPVEHPVTGHLKRLPDGQQAGEEAKAAFAEANGGADLPPGFTWCTDYGRGGSKAA